jgi:hypothetical protein
MDWRGLPRVSCQLRGTPESLTPHYLHSSPDTHPPKPKLPGSNYKPEDERSKKLLAKSVLVSIKV